MKYIDFLKDQKFVWWQLFPDEDSDRYWDEYIRNHPEDEEALQRAITLLKTKALNKSDLTREDQTELWQRICFTVNSTVKKVRYYRIIRYVASACAALLIFAVGFGLYRSYKQTETGVICGSVLNSEDIRLITSNSSITFQNNIRIEINSEGSATITQHRNGSESEVCESEVETVEIGSKDFNKLIVPFGKRTQLTLADGSRLWLNSGSELDFPAQFTGHKRRIRLVSGEMYIEVAPDKKRPFRVQVDDMDVQVYGTRFNVAAYDGDARVVTLVEGSIGLRTPGNDEVALAPFEQAAYQSGKSPVVTHQVDVNNIVSWKDGYLIFEKTPISDVLEQIGRYYNLSFNYDKGANLKYRKCSGKIYLSADLDNVMTTISLLSETTYIKENDRILITNNPD